MKDYAQPLNYLSWHNIQPPSLHGSYQHWMLQVKRDLLTVLSLCQTLAMCLAFSEKRFSTAHCHREFLRRIPWPEKVKWKTNKKTSNFWLLDILHSSFCSFSYRLGKPHCYPTKMWLYSWFGTDFLLIGNLRKPPFARSSEPWRTITQFFTHWQKFFRDMKLTV